MKRMFGIFLLVLGIMPTWNNVIADDLLVVPVKAQFTSWDKKIPGSTRFKLVMDGQAVLDRETGLVWEKTLCSTQSPAGACDGPWWEACFSCWNKVEGGRRGWRLPKLEELLSLLDMSESSPALPKDHPFNYVRSAEYWTSTSWPGGIMLGLDLKDGEIYTHTTDIGTLYTWCVRGGCANSGY